AGKSLRFIRSNVKPRRKKYFPSVFRKYVIVSARPAPDQEGRFAIVTNVGKGMRWTQWRARTRRVDADGQAVWSWRPDAGVNPRVKSPGGRGLSSPAPRGEYGAAVNTIAQGRPDVSADL